MKFLFALAALAGAVSAQSTECAATYIVDTCLGTEQGLVRTRLSRSPRRAMANECSSRSTPAPRPTTRACVPPTKPSTREFPWFCRTTVRVLALTRNSCFNNCPNDPRASSANNQQIIYCGYASQFNSKTTTPVSAPTGSQSLSGPAATQTGAGATTTPTGGNSPSKTASGAASTSTGAAVDLVMNTGGVLLAVAGVVAAVL